MSEKVKSYVTRAVWTAIQAAAAAAIATIGSTATIGGVDWRVVASTAGLAGVLSLLKSVAVGTPETKASSIEDEQ